MTHKSTVNKMHIPPKDIKTKLPNDEEIRR